MPTKITGCQLEKRKQFRNICQSCELSVERGTLKYP